MQHPPRFSVTMALTAGLGSLFDEISHQSGNPRALVANEARHTDLDGRLKLRNLPLLARRYRFEEAIGEGTFAQLLRATDMHSSRKRSVALKVLNTNYSNVGIQEAAHLRHLNAADRDSRCHVVQLLDAFSFGKHVCLVLEMLNDDLLTYHQRNNFSATQDLMHIRKVAVQILAALAFLRQQGYIHADLKPENILMVNDSSGGVQLKLIDFGNAMDVTEQALYHDDFEVQSLFYRAPELLVGKKFTGCIDIWSFGCVLFELWMGKPLFEGNVRAGVIGAQVQILGPYPLEIASGGHFMDEIDQTCQVHWREPQSKPFTSSDTICSLQKVLHPSKDLQFADFLASCLKFSPEQRSSPRKALCHPFLSHLFPFAIAFEGEDGCSRVTVDPGSPGRAAKLEPSSAKATALDAQSELRKKSDSSPQHKCASWLSGILTPEHNAPKVEDQRMSANGVDAAKVSAEVLPTGSLVPTVQIHERGHKRKEGRATNLGQDLRAPGIRGFPPQEIKEFHQHASLSKDSMMDTDHETSATTHGEQEEDVLIVDDIDNHDSDHLNGLSPLIPESSRSIFDAASPSGRAEDDILLM